MSSNSPVLGRACCGVCEQEAFNALPEDTPPSVFLARSFIVCPTCGNKRCPKATHHTHVCTGSNESGQNGSSWGALWPCDRVLSSDEKETPDVSV